MDQIKQRAIDLHKKHQGKLATVSLVDIQNRDDLSLAYTPGVAAVASAVAEKPELSFDLTWRGRTVAVISDGSAVLGLGNIGPEGALPVMEGKSLLLKRFANVDSVPLVLDTHDPAKIIEIVKNLAPSFAGVNLEDIAAPACFQIEESLQDIGIPVFHDDQHGTAIVVTAALHNAAKVVGKPFESLKVVIVGAGAAGLAVSRMLLGLNCSEDSCQRLPGSSSVKDVIVVDSKGALYTGRENMNIYKQAIAGLSNQNKLKGDLEAVAKGADVLIGVSGPGNITPQAIRVMADKPIVFAMANPTPEIMPEEAKAAGAYIVATGRSDFPNQINNLLAFPAIFKAVVDGRLTTVTHAMKEAAAKRLASLVENPTPDYIVPDPFFEGLVDEVSKAILGISFSR
ncbi:MAG TPA: NADP-dependent malic enzyme [Patescibacteria group bacterium]|nr:NADP-dependent malic enzyme [Patescibacteria group bacterium]